MRLYLIRNINTYTFLYNSQPPYKVVTFTSASDAANYLNAYTHKQYENSYEVVTFIEEGTK